MIRKLEQSRKSRQSRKSGKDEGLKKLDIKGKKGFDDSRVEFDGGVFGYVVAGLFSSASLAARAVVGQGRVRVREAKDAGADRDLFAAKTVGVPFAAPPFLVPANEKLHATAEIGRAHV